MDKLSLCFLDHVVNFAQICCLVLDFTEPERKNLDRDNKMMIQDFELTDLNFHEISMSAIHRTISIMKLEMITCESDVMLEVVPDYWPEEGDNNIEIVPI